MLFRSLGRHASLTPNACDAVWCLCACGGTRACVCVVVFVVCVCEDEECVCKEEVGVDNIVSGETVRGWME